MFTEYNPNPAGRRVGDCAVRAVAKALDTDWETAYIRKSDLNSDCDSPSRVLLYTCSRVRRWHNGRPCDSTDTDEMIDVLAHACKNVCKIIESKDEYSMDGGSYRGNSYYGNGRYSRDGYYYDGEGNSTRRGRGMNGRFVSRDGSDMARQLRDMMADAPDEQTRNDIRKLVEKMENR